MNSDSQLLFHLACIALVLDEFTAVNPKIKYSNKIAFHFLILNCKFFRRTFAISLTFVTQITQLAFRQIWKFVTDEIALIASQEETLFEESETSFFQNLTLKCAKNSALELLNCKIFWVSMPPDPLEGSGLWPSYIKVPPTCTFHFH